jgi:hypothetical protein
LGFVRSPTLDSEITSMLMLGISTLSFIVSHEILHRGK